MSFYYSKHAQLNAFYVQMEQVNAFSHFKMSFEQMH